jgi:hypothetical protein
MTPFRRRSHNGCVEHRGMKMKTNMNHATIEKAVAGGRAARRSFLGLDVVFAQLPEKKSARSD